MKPDEEFDKALEDLLRCWHAFDRVLSLMKEAQTGQPGARSYDSPMVGGHSTVLDEFGVPMPAISDPTGEAGIGADEARVDEADTLSDVRQLKTIGDRMVWRFARYQARAATEKQRRETEKANDPGCELCARMGQFSPPRVLSSDAKGNLDRPHRLCTWHYEFVLATGRKPTDDEERAHIAGKPVRLKVS